MEISQVTNGFNIGYYEIDEEETRDQWSSGQLGYKPIKFVKNPNIDEEIYRDVTARVYIISSDNIIKKIGGSADKAGVISTMRGYISGAQGSAGKSRFICMHLFRDELRLNESERLEVHLIQGERITYEAQGLFTTRNAVSNDFKSIENLCMDDYKSVSNNSLPDWNFQGIGSATYPETYSNLYFQFDEDRNSRRDFTS